MAKVRAPVKHLEFLRIDKDYPAAAQAANLSYVSDSTEGILREPHGKSFQYKLNGSLVRDEETLSRIRKLVIPPAWKNVWICPEDDGHIQATGIDAAGRKQYRYHPRWSALQQETKFHRLIEFGKALPLLRARIESDLQLTGFTEHKVLAMAVSLMERTYIRVGSEGYERQYGSYGLTTLKNKHVKVEGTNVKFSFKGKKGVYHRISIKSKRLARIIKQCKSIPGSELFQYCDAEGNWRKIDSGQVNQYIKDGTRQEFTTKDFRTWAGTIAMLQELRSAAPCETLTDLKRQVKTSLDVVSRKLGNTVAVCRKYYVHPDLIELYLQQQLHEHCKESDSKGSDGQLRDDERLLMRILRYLERQKARPTLTSKLLQQSIKRQKRQRNKAA